MHWSWGRCPPLAMWLSCVFRVLCESRSCSPMEIILACDAHGNQRQFDGSKERRRTTLACLASSQSTVTSVEGSEIRLGQRIEEPGGEYKPLAWGGGGGNRHPTCLFLTLDHPALNQTTEAYESPCLSTVSTPCLASMSTRSSMILSAGCAAATPSFHSRRLMSPV